MHRAENLSSSLGCISCDMLLKLQQIDRVKIYIHNKFFFYILICVCVCVVMIFTKEQNNIIIALRRK